MSQTQGFQRERRRVSRETTSQDNFAALTLSELLQIVWRFKTILLAIPFASIILGILWILIQTPQYTSTTVVQINSRNAQVLDDITSVVSSVEREALAIQSEVDVLSSPYLARRVVQKLELTETQEFKRELPKVDDNAEQQDFLLSSATALLQKKYHISRVPQSLTINISVELEDPALARDVANEIANEYLNMQLEQRFDATKDANTWLTQRLKELHQRLAESEQALQMYKEEHNLFDKHGVTVNDQQLSEINSQLILARADQAAAAAKLRQARKLIGSGRGVDSSSEVLESRLIQNLREQEAELVRQEAELATRYGAKHPQMIKIRAEKKDLDQKIEQEMDKIIRNLENELAIQNSRIQSLEDGLQNTQKKVGQTSAAEIRLAELVREVNSNRTLYESFLNRSKETAQQQDLKQTDARVISPATKAIKPSSPNKPVILIVATFLGLILALSLVLALEYLDNSFRTLNQLERTTRYAGLGIVPKLEGQNPLEYFKAKPTSLFAESLRKIQTSIHFSNPEKAPQVLMITSSLSGEGKTLLSVSLAHAATQAGLKVVVLDADMRRPTVNTYLHMEPQQTLADFLSGKVTLKKALSSSKNAGFDTLLSTPGVENSNALLSSEDMSKLIDQLRKSYDLVIIDTPPLNALVDALTLARKVDTTVFVTRWGHTAQSVVNDAVKLLKSHRLPVAGVVLSQVDLDKDQKYGYNSYKRYSQYYTD